MESRPAGITVYYLIEFVSFVYVDVVAIAVDHEVVPVVEVREIGYQPSSINDCGEVAVSWSVDIPTGDRCL